MARFNPGVLGEVRGKIGDYVVRKMNGKYFVSLRPPHYKISQNQKAKDSRNSFGICVKFARAINTCPELASIWRSAPLEGTSAYHKILKHNLSMCNEGKLTINNMITPAGSVNPVKDVSFSRASLIIQVDKETAERELKTEQLKIFYLLYLHQHISKKNKSEQFIIFSSELDINNSPELHKSFSGTYERLFGEFNKFMIYTAVLYKNELKSLYSSTKCFEV